MNSKIPYIDVNNFVETLKGLIVLYFNEDDSLDIAKEYMLFKFMNDPYILWIKYKRMDELSKIWGLKCDLFINVKKKQISLNLMVKKKLYFLKVVFVIYNKKENIGN